MRAAIVSTIYEHGTILSEFGTAIALAMEHISEISEVCIYTTISESKNNPFKHTTEIIPLINPKRPASYLKLFYALKIERFDVIVINSMPTSQGSSLISNFLYLLIPLFLSKKKKERTRILYHNSPYLNDIGRLGYRGLKTRFQTYVLKFIEKRVFRSIRTLFLLKKYAMKIEKEIPASKVSFISGKNMAAFSSLYLNGKLDFPLLPTEPPEGNVPNLLLYGFWGPQKDLRTALLAIRMVRHESKKFRTVLAGGINEHFQRDVEWYENIILEFHDTIDTVLGYLGEEQTLELFLKSNIIILPYRAVGGFSGVLSHAMFFGLSVIAPRFDEYVEQCGKYPNVQFIPVDYSINDIASALRSIMDVGNYERNRISPKSAFQDFVKEFDRIVIGGI